MQKPPKGGSGIGLTAALATACVSVRQCSTRSAQPALGFARFPQFSGRTKIAAIGTQPATGTAGQPMIDFQRGFALAGLDMRTPFNPPTQHS